MSASDIHDEENNSAQSGASHEDDSESIEALESREAEQKAKKAEFAKMLGDSFNKKSKKLSVGDRIKGELLVVGKNEDVFVSTGTMTDGIVSRRELMDAEGNVPFKVGDVLDFYVIQVRSGEIRLSRKATGKNLASDLEDAYDMMMPISGRIVEVCNGGVRVNIKGKLAFCPISQIDIVRVENAEDYVGKQFDFRITQFSEGGRNIVVSRRKLLDEERELSAGSFLEEHKDGDLVQGRVTRLEKFGAFIELAPGIDGLAHISELSWSRVGDPSEVVQVGQEVTVKLLKRETVGDRVKISVSIKQAGEGRPSADASASGAANAPNPNDPFTKFPVGTIVTGKVERKELYGLFIQLAPGITGLLHKSKSFDHPEFGYDKIKVNDQVTVQVAEIRREERKISLDVPQDPNRDDWKTHTQNTGSFGTLGDKLKNMAVKKK
ncbi:MAG: S1 RNA-binding domain-containing protein [Methylotenera sp.]|nr:S1 RNA-binding domain-containing protein [Oligoflexia bacterium]